MKHSKTVLLRARSITRCGIGLLAFANFCFGQSIVSQEDSLVPDSAHTVSDTTKVASPDTAQQQPAMSKADSVAPIPQKEPERVVAEPPAPKLSPFSSDKMHCIGLSLDYFQYRELINIREFFPPGFPMNLVQGTPKSHEYGLMFGFNYEGAIRQHGSPVLFRPKVDVQIGIHQAYDGSTQAVPVLNSNGDTTGYGFFPVNVYKNNYLVRAGVDIGYCRTRAIVPFYVYTGIKGKLWYRDLQADTTSYSNQITNSEVYYWFSAPIGLMLSYPVSPTLALSVDASCDIMFAGYMQLLNSAWDSQNTYKTEAPSVTLGNKPGYRLEFSAVYKTENGTVFRFTPYFNYYSFGRSEMEMSKYFINGIFTGKYEFFSEPSSVSWLIGLKIQMVFLSPATRTR